jgi:DME family drug/metabolite transporter
VSSVAIGSARLVIGGAGLIATLPLLGGSRRSAISLWRNRWGFMAGLMTALYQLAFFAGVSRAGVALATLVTIGSGPIFVGLFILGEHLGLAGWAGAALVAAGLGLQGLSSTRSRTGEPNVIEATLA